MTHFSPQERLQSAQQWLAMYENKNVLTRADYLEIARLEKQIKALKQDVRCGAS
jgi:hypothetical protein